MKTSFFSLVAIIILLSSQIPHFQWVGVTLIGWCGMQFAELLLWLTNPKTKGGCTYWNELITLTLIPFILILQPLGSLWGSLYIIPWKDSSQIRKTFMVLYSALMILLVGFEHFYKPQKTCTTVTENGHLNWNTKDHGTNNYFTTYLYFGWAVCIAIPLLLFWNGGIALPIVLLIMPTFGFITGLKTDSRASVWCYYTSHVSVFSILALAAHKYKLYDFLPKNGQSTVTTFAKFLG